MLRASSSWFFWMSAANNSRDGSTRESDLLFGCWSHHSVLELSRPCKQNDELYILEGSGRSHHRWASSGRGTAWARLGSLFILEDGEHGDKVVSSRSLTAEWSGNECSRASRCPIVVVRVQVVSKHSNAFWSHSRRPWTRPPSPTPLFELLYLILSILQLKQRCPNAQDLQLEVHWQNARRRPRSRRIKWLLARPETTVMLSYGQSIEPATFLRRLYR